ncbi:MAG: 16S rRNA (guanine(527)-N(7))-methyltransferase RsmG [Clostridia bacterium]|nr:16S rRNA (guanine(527)-N(7))-methyltransferase RsmG [Clostridia bacterium]
MTFNEYFREALEANGITEFAPLADSFRIYADLLRQTNEKYNLTAITDDCGMAYKHFADCLLAVRHFPEGAKVLDVGCGGGFPTLPLAIARPDLTITAMDSTAKKLGFIGEVCDALGLSNVTTLCARAEEAGHTELREGFDVVTARAVARLNILAEWCSPMVKVGGTFLALKGKDGAAELSEAKNAFSVLHLTGEAEEYLLHTPEGDQGRCVITAVKDAHTPREYPRGGGKIKKKPL